VQEDARACLLKKENMERTERFPKSNRLLKAADFNAVKNFRLAFRSNFFKIALKPASRSRLGIVASRKAGNAVERNRIKRLVREFFRKNKQAFPKANIVVIVFTNAKEASQKALQKDLQLIARKATRKLQEVR